MKRFDAVMHQWEMRQQAAVTKFANLAALEDQEEPDFVIELLKAVFIAALGHFGGHIFGAATGVAATALSSAVKNTSVHLLSAKNIEEIVRRVTDVSTDAIQSISGGGSGQTKLDPQARARAFFVAMMQIDIADRCAQYTKNLNALQGAGEISPDHIDVVSSIFEHILPSAHDAFLLETTKAWTKYVVRSRVPAKKLDKSVSDMRDYFGTQRAGGTRDFSTSKAHGAGVLSIRMIVDPPGTRPRIDHTATQLVGMNSQLKEFLLNAAGRQFDKIDLPKEVSVNTDYGRAVIALNERNEVQDVLNWSDVVRKVGVESGQRFWTLWGKGLVLK
jgi:hypothetical protein